MRCIARHAFPCLPARSPPRKPRPGEISGLSGPTARCSKIAARIAYRNLELKRWKDFLSSPIKPEPAFFPCDDTLAARTVIAAREAGEMVSPLVNAVCTALWVEDRNIADRDTLAEILVASGYDADRTLKSAQSDDIGAVYEADTAEAVALGVFGSPTYVYNGELFCGQDRLDFLKRALVSG